MNIEENTMQVCYDCLEDEHYGRNKTLVFHYTHSDGFCGVDMTIFSKSSCDYCGSKLAGTRYTASLAE